MPLLDRDGVNVYYEVHGRGPAILLTHGYSATSLMWRPQIEPLSRNHTVIVWDMRGHGQSDSPQDDAAYTQPSTLEDMAALLDHAGFEKATLGGLSLGGFMTLAFYLEYPERASALLLVDTGPGFKRDEARNAWNERAHDIAERIEDDWQKALEQATPERLVAVHTDLRGVARAGRGMLTQHSSRVIESLPQISVPTLVVVGAEDEAYLAATDYMASRIPEARKLLVRDAGHAVNIDQPQVFNEAILAFLEQHDL